MSIPKTYSVYIWIKDQKIGGAIWTFTTEQFNAAKQAAGPMPHGGTIEEGKKWLEDLYEALFDAGATEHQEFVIMINDHKTEDWPTPPDICGIY